MRLAARSRWRSFSHWPELGENETHVWKVDLNRVRSHTRDFEPILPLSERREASKHAVPLERDLHILTCALRRSILARYLRAKPSELKFTYNQYGKPQLRSGELRFNVSHSFGLLVCAVSRCFDVGVDVQRIRMGVEENIAGWFLPLRTLRLLETLPQPLRTQTFFQGWARMEAYGKALGLGLAENVYNLETLLETANTWFHGASSGKDGSCRLQDFQPRKGYAAAVATRGGDGKLTYCNWPARCAITS